MKLYRNIIIIAVIIAVLGIGAYFATNYTPNGNEAIETEENETSEMFNIYKADSENIIRLNVKNDEGEYFVEKSGDKWVLNGDKSIKIKESSVKSLAYTCSSVSVKQVVSETEKDAKSFGFDENSSYVELIFKDGSKQKIHVGNKTLDNENYYIKLENKPKIYLKNAYGTESIIPRMETLRDLSLMSIDATNYGIIKKIEISKTGNMPICIVNTADKATEEIPYRFEMTKPAEANISGEIFADKIINCLQSLEADAVMEDHAKDLSFYGFDKPYAEFNFVTKDASYLLKIGGETESYRFLTLNNSDTVYAVEKSKLGFIDVSYIDLMSSTIHVEYVNTVDSIEVMYGETKYNIKIKGDDKKRTYTINDKNVNTDDAVLAYRALIGISLDSISLEDKPDIKPESYIKYYKKDGTVSTVEFIPVSERNYRVLVNGKGNSITAKKNFKDAVSMIEKAINNAK